MIYRSNQYEQLMANDHPVYEYDGDVGLADIKRFMKNYHGRKGQQVCIHELGVGRYRFDFVSLNPYKHRIRILEYKVSRGDFNGDTKHLAYMGYCNTFSFVTPLGLISVGDLKDQRAGLQQVFRWKRRNSRINRWNLGAIWLKMPRGLGLGIDTYYKVSDMMLARVVQGRKGDFF